MWMGGSVTWDEKTADNRVSKAYTGAVGRGAGLMAGGLDTVREGCLVS